MDYFNLWNIFERNLIQTNILRKFYFKMRHCFMENEHMHNLNKYLNSFS